MDKELNFNYLPILINEEMDLKLANDGYVTFPLLDKTAIDNLLQYYLNFQKEIPNHFYSSSHSPDFEFRKKSSDCIKQIISPELPNKLKNFTLLGGAFVVKPANGKGILQPHQDWNLVDESVSRSYNLWIPLVDVTPENGAVFVLPESHKKEKSFRGPGIPSAFKLIESELWKSLIPIPMKSGQALLYDHALLHGSPSNKTKKDRIGVVCGLINKEAEMQLYFKNEDLLEVFKIDESFFLKNNPIEGPKGLVKKTELSDKIIPHTDSTFQQVYLKKKNTKKSYWLTKLFQLK